MIGVRTGADVEAALETLARAANALATGAPQKAGLSELVRAAATGTGAEVAVLWLSERDTAVSIRDVWSVSAGIAAELDGLRAASLAAGMELLLDRLGGEREFLTVPFETAAGDGALALVRREGAFDRGAAAVATLAAELAGLAFRLEAADPVAARGDGTGLLEVAGDALDAVTDDDGAAGARVARLAAVAAGAEAAQLWRLRDGRLEVEGTSGPLAADASFARAASALLEEADTLAVQRAAHAGHLVTLQLGQPALGALQLLFPPGPPPDEQDLGRLAAFAVRAAHALRSSERAHDARLELERSRALLSLVGEAIARLSLSHTLDTAIERVAALLDADRVAVYLCEEGKTAVAASRGVEGPHERVAEALLRAALSGLYGSTIVDVPDAARDERLGPVRAQAEESGIVAAVAVALVVGHEPIGLLAVYPRQPRPLTGNESALLSALAVQLAVAVQNARLHERATALGADLEGALASELQKSKRLNALYEISRSFAQSLSLDTTLDVLAESIVTLLGVDAAVIRMPDERRAELIARAVKVNDERVDAAAKALLLRPQQLPRRELLRLLERREPLLLDAERAEELGGSVALLAPFLRKGSSAAVIPIATATELLATLTIVSLHPGRPVAGEIAETALSIAGQAALAIDNARLYGQQKAFADTMQRSLLPRAAPELPGLELGDVYESAARVEVGGDVYDYVALGDGRLAVVLGDVTGHGVDATADMAMAKYVFRSLAREHPSPGEFLAAANEVVCSDIGAGRFITMVVLVVDAEAGEVCCASAGHPPPRLVLADGTVEPIAAQGLALGIDAPQRYETVRAPFPPGAIIVAYTDGVIEARRSGEQFGMTRFDELLTGRRTLPPQEIAEAALMAARGWTGDELSDDFAVVVIKRTAGR